jgi:hypothetical protein
LSSYPLPAVPYLRLRPTLVCREPAHLPPYKGSMLRGAFGHALRRAVCAMGPEQPCPTCPLRRACVHPRLFETLIEGDPPPFLHGLPTAPRPYVFEPGGEERDFAPGDPLDFDLLLFGQAVDLQAYAVVALERMAEAGLGARRARFALERVDYLVGEPGAPTQDDSLGAPDRWEPGFRAGERPWPDRVPPLLPAPRPLGDAATLRFLTPTRLKADRRLVARPTFRDLVFRMLRRTLEIAHFHVPGAALDWEFHPLLERASAVRVVAADLAWLDWERYSNRQQTSMRLGGFVGAMQLAGDLAPFAPLLAGAEILHVGKGATFGLGRVRVE